MKRPLLALGLAVVVALAGLGTWLLLRPDGDRPPPDSGPDASSLADAADATPTPVAPDASTESGPDASSPGELDWMIRIRAATDSRPAEALALAAEADRLFPSGRLADERAYLSMSALVHLGRVGDARSAAVAFHRRFPDSEWTERVVRLTGYAPRRYGPKR